MKFVKLFVVILATSCLATASFAGKKPEACPSTKALAQAEFISIKYDTEYKDYLALAVDRFGTSQRWGFIVILPGDQANSLADALNKANAVVPTLSGEPRPIGNVHTWSCEYLNKYDYITVAVLPKEEAANHSMNIKDFKVSSRSMN